MKFRKATDLISVKSVARTFLHLPIETTEVTPIVVQHPIFENGFFMAPSKNQVIPQMLDILNSPEDRAAANAFITELINTADSLQRVAFIIRQPYHMTFLKYIKDYLSREDFSKMLGDAWTNTENPNCDPNVPLSTAVRWFRAADKVALMNEEELAQYEAFGDEVTVYRGVAVGRNPQGLSWTDNLEKAKWFAHRFDRGDQKGYVQEAKVTKDRILAYFSRRDEYEIVVDTKDLDIHVCPDA